ncbi:MAG: hypothetical protein U9P72_08410 [Campylobacterota bacterium]|nr:hypothetical protein [Campylobacterota bacterium]
MFKLSSYGLSVKSSFISLSVVASIVLFSGCAKEQLILKTYNPPKKQEQVKKMIENSESSIGFINLQVVEDLSYICEVIGKDSDSRTMANGLISNLKKFINQTNFISLNQIEDSAAVSLDMQIMGLNFVETKNSRSLDVTVNFVIRKDGLEFYSEPYTYNDIRKSRAGLQGIASKNEMFNDGSEYLAKKLIKDISPVKSRKLVELKDLPDELKYTIKYAKGKNFKGAIKAMEKYKGEKELEYYFNLGVYYEGYGSQIDNMAMFSKAQENYEKAMAMGGSEDETIVKGKLKFDNFYEVIKKVAEQQAANLKQTGAGEYELLD